MRDIALFFSRGRGRGHSIPDDALCKEILLQRPSIRIQFVSYSTGALTLRELGWDVIDAPVSEFNHFSVTMRPFLEIIRTVSPRWVVSHEEPGALIAAAASAVPSVFLTDWFRPDIDALTMPLGFAAKILLLDEPGMWPEPDTAIGKIVHTGPMLRDLDSSGHNASSLRKDFGIDNGVKVVLVTSGGPSEREAPLRNLVLAAFHRLSIPRKHLLWVAAEQELPAIQEATRGMDNLTLLPPHVEFVQTMLISDLAITKGNRITCLELDALVHRFNKTYPY